MVNSSASPRIRLVPEVRYADRAGAPAPIRRFRLVRLAGARTAAGGASVLTGGKRA